MPTLCAVYKCGHNNIRDKEHRFFRIPKIIRHQGEQTQKLSTERRSLWLQNINRDKNDLTEKKMDGTRECRAHFVSGKPSKLEDTSNVDWAPTVNILHSNIKDTTKRAERDKRASKRALNPKQPSKKASKRPKVKHLDAEVVLTSVQATNIETPPSCSGFLNEGNSDDLPLLSQDDPAPLQLLPENQDKQCQTGNSVECQTILMMDDLDRQKVFLDNTTTELQYLKEKLLETELNYNSFQGNDEKTKFYTGITTFAILMHVFDLVSTYVISTKRNALPQFQEFILSLMRIRLNMPLQDLAYRFNISVPTAGRICDRWHEVMSERLGFLVRWPEREQLRSTMPNVFRKSFGDKVSVIIDCFEVFIDKPSSLIAQAMTWSNYKHHNTIKFLIGITPQDTVSYMSKAWGGRVSDKHITENCGILRKLEPGDIVLADRGFNIEDSVGFYQAKLHIPAFTRGKKQLSAKEVEETRKIANVRIHVECVIGLVRRKYVILQSTLPIDLIKAKPGESLSPIDKIAKISYCLTNLCESVVPFK